MTTVGFTKLSKKWRICPICKRDFPAQTAIVCMECKNRNYRKKLEGVIK